MTTSTVIELVRNGNPVGERVELACYTIPTAGERIIYGQSVDGVVRLVDVRADGRGRAYLIERELETDGFAALKALVTDYLEQASAHAQIPMQESVLDRYLRHLGDHVEAI